jgi:hypothetical protein
MIGMAMSRRQFLAGGAAVVVAGAGGAYFALRQMGGMEEYNASVSATRAALRQTPEIGDLIRYATLAANSHNGTVRGKSACARSVSR